MKKLALRVLVEVIFQFWYYVGKHWQWLDKDLKRYYTEKIKELEG